MSALVMVAKRNRPIVVAGDLNVELCNECHPFFTGKQKLVDTGGRVERFNKRYGTRKKTVVKKEPVQK